MRRVDMAIRNIASTSALVLVVAQICTSSAYSEDVPNALDGYIHCKQAEDTQSNTQPSNPMWTCSFRVHQAASDGHKNPDQQKPNSRWYSSWLLMSRWISRLIDDPVALFTFVLAISTILLWRETKRLAKGAEAQSDHIEVTANAAKTSANVAVTTLRDLERPYVFVSNLEPVTQPAGPHLRLDLSNYGRTPAVMRKLTLRLRLVSSLDEQEKIFDKTDERLISKVIGASQSIERLRFAVSWIDESSVNALTWSTLLAYVDIVIWYDDVFDNPTRIKEFNYLFDPGPPGVFSRVQDVYDFDYYTQKKRRQSDQGEPP
jgi:hypothetical protein